MNAYRRMYWKFVLATILFMLFSVQAFALNATQIFGTLNVDGSHDAVVEQLNSVPVWVLGILAVLLVLFLVLLLFGLPEIAKGFGYVLSLGVVLVLAYLIVKIWVLK